MASPQVTQGTLSRLRGSIVFSDHPELNITASFLGPEGINMTPEGDITQILPTMVGTVNSPEPYQMMTVEIELLKSQSFSDLFKQQLEGNSVIGDFTVRPDSTTLSPFQIQNGAIMTASAGRLNGTSVAYMVSLRGYYTVNALLFNAA